MSVLILALLLLKTIEVIDGAKIIMASSQLGSHILEQLAVGEELASRGHEVYVAVGSRYPKIADIEKRGIKAITYKIPDDVLYGVSEEFEKYVAGIIFSKAEDKMSASGKLASETTFRDCTYMMSDETFLKEVQKISFDLAIVEPFVRSLCNLILPKYLGIPHISMSGVFVPWDYGIPALPSFTPMFAVWTSPSDLTFISRIKNFFTFVTMGIYLNSVSPQNNTLLEKFAPEVKSWNELASQSELYLMASDHHIGFSFPQMPNFISSAGLSTSKAKKLPQDLETIVQNSKDGVILLSFGSTAYYFPAEVIAKFLEAFGKLNQTVLVKFFIPDNVQLPKNVKALSWLPQNDILGHPNTKLFITHCGNSGQHEALYHAVPMLGFPLFAEQHLNCHRIYKKGFGLEMNIQKFTSEELFNKIQEILNNPIYRSSIGKASEIFRDQPMHPRARAAFWIEHVIRHGGGGHLRSLAMDLPLYQFLMLDILGVLLAAMFAVLLILRFLVKLVIRKFKGSSPKRSGSKLKSN